MNKKDINDQITHFCKENPISCIIIILIILYMSFVRPRIVPKFFNNPIIRILLFLLVIYVYNENQLIAILFGLLIILSISLLNKQEYFNSPNTGSCSEEAIDNDLTQYKATLYPPN